jgi:5-dehydro-2-deoxygluconokinase
MMFKFNQQAPLDVICVGRATVDIYAKDIGLLENAKTFAKYLGGSPANTAVAMAKQGLNVGVITKVSADGMGNFVKNYLSHEHIDISNVVTDQDGHLTGITIGEILGGGKCSCLMYRNDCADLYLRPEEINENYIKKAKSVLISGTSLSKSPAREAVLKIIKVAKDLGVVVIFDPDYREGTWSNKDDASTYLALAATLSDLIISTDDEMQLVYKGLNKSIAYSKDIVAESLLKAGVSMVNIKDGSRGSTIYTADLKVNCPCYSIPGVLKTFGAGDSYAAGFVAQIIENGDCKFAAQRGAASAAITISGHSCSESAPTYNQVQEFMKTHELNLQ